MDTLVAVPHAPLLERYATAALSVLDPEERRRLLDGSGSPRDEEQLAWELLYRIEPGLYDRLVAGERLHEAILEWLPADCGSVLEIGAGTGRLTVHLAGRSRQFTAVEPAAPMRAILLERLRVAGAGHVRVVPGFFDELPVPQGSHDLVISCSAFPGRVLPDAEHCLEVMESRCVPGGLLVLVWPADVAWLCSRGYEYVAFEGPMLVEFESVEAAVALARIFYPEAVDAIGRRGSRFVDYAHLGLNAPRDLCWRRCG